MKVSVKKLIFSKEMETINGEMYTLELKNKLYKIKMT